MSPNESAPGSKLEDYTPEKLQHLSTSMNALIEDLERRKSATQMELGILTDVAGYLEAVTGQHESTKAEEAGQRGEWVPMTDRERTTRLRKLRQIRKPRTQQKDKTMTAIAAEQLTRLKEYTQASDMPVRVEKRADAVIL